MPPIAHDRDGRSPRRRVFQLPQELVLVQARMSVANAFLVRRGARAMLVDTGSTGDLPRIAALLREQGLNPGSVAIVVLTHGHADHAGTASQLQALGMPILAGRGDAATLARGSNGRLSPQSLFARLLTRLVQHAFVPIRASHWLDGPMNLGSWGFADVSIESLPGHTAGSLVITLPGDVVLAGDLILGGHCNGALWPQRPLQHYFQDDAEANRRNVELLLARGTRRFFVGHGGPIDADAVRPWLAAMRPTPSRCGFWRKP